MQFTSLELFCIIGFDDDVIIPSPTLDFAFAMWQYASSAIGIHKLLLKVAFFHWNTFTVYLFVWLCGVQLLMCYFSYTFDLCLCRNYEDSAMSLLVVDAIGAPPIWVNGKMYEIGPSGISSLKGHNKRRNK
ncbi:unnamed protein product [Malus baccata var. baccata]